MQSAVLIIATSKNFIQPKLVYPTYHPVKLNGMDKQYVMIATNW